MSTRSGKTPPPVQIPPPAGDRLGRALDTISGRQGGGR